MSLSMVGWGAGVEAVVVAQAKIPKPKKNTMPKWIAKPVTSPPPRAAMGMFAGFRLLIPN